MLEGIYAWTCSIAGYFLFVTVLEQLLPGKKYSKYVRLFSGMVLILLVVQPFINKEQIEAKIALDYETLLFQYEAGDLKEEILGIEHQRLEQMIRQYEEAVEGDIRLMAEDGGVEVKDCQVTICADQEKENFGTVSMVTLSVYTGEEKERNVDGKENDQQETQPEAALAGSEETVARIDSVQPVAVDLSESRGAERKKEVNQAPVSGLRKKIADYYNLEEAYVEIQIVEGQG